MNGSYHKLIIPGIVSAFFAFNSFILVELYDTLKDQRRVMLNLLVTMERIDNTSFKKKDQAEFLKTEFYPLKARVK